MMYRNVWQQQQWLRAGHSKCRLRVAMDAIGLSLHVRLMRIPSADKVFNIFYFPWS